MKERQNLQNSNISDYFNSNNISSISKNNACNITKNSNESNEFKELNREIFQKIQQGENLSGINYTNISLSSNNNSLPSFNDINWKKNNSRENSSLYDNKKDFFQNDNSSLSNISNIPKKQIETLNMRNTFDDKDDKDDKIYGLSIQEETYEDSSNNNIHINNMNNMNNYQNNNKFNYRNKFEDNQYPCNSDEMDPNIPNNISNNYPNNNQPHPVNNYYNYYSNNSYNNNPKMNYTVRENEKNFVPKSNYQMLMNNTNNNMNNIVIDNNSINKMNNNLIPQNINQNYIYYQTQYNINSNTNNYFFSPNPTAFMFPENAFSYNNNANINNNNNKLVNNSKHNNNSNNINNSPNNNKNSNNNNNKNWKDNKKSIPKKKFKDKLEKGLFIINLDNIISGIDQRTTVMIRHIPNKYTTKTLMEELDTICKNRYDFFYLPLDNENNCNLGYAFINFINPLHIVHFYHIFKQRKWRFFKSHKECDLTFAKFQGKSELTANLDKNMNKIEDKSKLPIVIDIVNPPKIDLEKRYFDEISKYRPELMKQINWI